MLPTLNALSGGAETPLTEWRARVAAAEGLTADDLRELLPSGRQPVFTNRVAWAITPYEVTSPRVRAITADREAKKGGYSCT